MAETDLSVVDDFEFLLPFLSAGWEDRAYALGALRRCRTVPDAPTLLRALLVHLAEGCSLLVHDAGLAWIEGKLLAAFFAETFFPWGCPLRKTPPTKSMSLA